MLGVKVSKEWFLLFRRNHNCCVMSGALLIANRASLEAFTHEQLIQLTGAAHRLPLHQVTVSECSACVLICCRQDANTIRLLMICGAHAMTDATHRALILQCHQAKHLA